MSLKISDANKNSKKDILYTRHFGPSEGLFSQAGLNQNDLRIRLDQALLEILTLTNLIFEYYFHSFIKLKTEKFSFKIVNKKISSDNLKYILNVIIFRFFF